MRLTATCVGYGRALAFRVPDRGHGVELKEPNEQLLRRF